MTAWGRQIIATGLKQSALALLLSASALASADLDYIGSVDLRPARSELSAGWTIQIFDPALTEIEFALASSFGTASVSGRDVADLQTRLQDDGEEPLRIYKITLAPAQEDGRPRRVKFAYGGPFRSLSLNAVQADHVELTGDSRWFPVAPDFDHRLSAQVGLRAPGEWTLVSAGDSEPVDTGFRLRQDRPAFDLALALLAAPETFETDGFTVYDARTEPRSGWAELEEALNGCRAFLNDLAGPAGPVPEAKVLLTNRSEGAYSRGSFLSLMDIENETPEALHKLVCHELSHHWSAASPGGPEDWINEGLAEFIALMAVRDHFGEIVFTDYLDEYAQSLEDEEIPLIWATNATGRTPSIIGYRAAPLALAELEDRIGPSDFRLFLQAAFAQKPEHTTELMALLETVSGPEIRAWFEQRLQT